jgi:hypothetical protein
LHTQFLVFIFFNQLSEEIGMDLQELIDDLAQRISKTKENVSTEEATKNAFIMPFIANLGYDVFNPMEVVPEFTADIGEKKGEKVDYCIMQDSEPSIIIECKHWNEPLDKHKSQLERYFMTTDAQFGIITNGINYQFFSGLEKNPSLMDKTPFLEFDIDKMSDNHFTELKKFRKEGFDAEQILSSASNLKHSNQIIEILSNEIEDPTEEFVKFFASKIHNGKVTKGVIEHFTPLVKKSAMQLISDMLDQRWHNAMENSKKQAQEISDKIDEEDAASKPDENGIITTQEEIDGFKIVQAILARKISPERLIINDTVAYCGILLDGKSRQTVCRLHFNGKRKKHITIIGENKKEDKIEIENVSSIYAHQDKLLASVEYYEKLNNAK